MFAGVTFREALRVVAAKIRVRANKLTDSEREALIGDAMRVICGSEGEAARAHRR